MTDNRTTELLPCPFCGGEAQVMHMDLDSIEEGWKVWGVWCVDDLNAEDYRNHGHFIDNYATEAEAVAAWNTRAEHGTLTAEQVREAAHGHYKLRMVRDVDGLDVPQAVFDWQAIADELNARAERTCEIESSFLNDFSSEHECWWEFDLSCGHHVTGDTMDSPNYCEVCGAKVVGK